MAINIPAEIGTPLEEIDTPCLLLELDQFERNVAKMAKFIKENGLRHRGHAKCHKSADIAAYLQEKGGTCGVCCQKVSEAEAMVSGGVRDVLVSNEVAASKKIERLAALAIAPVSWFASTTWAMWTTCRPGRRNTELRSSAWSRSMSERAVAGSRPARPRSRSGRKSRGPRPQIRRPAILSREGPARL